FEHQPGQVLDPANDECRPGLPPLQRALFWDRTRVRRKCLHRAANPRRRLSNLLGDNCARPSEPRRPYRARSSRTSLVSPHVRDGKLDPILLVCPELRLRRKEWTYPMTARARLLISGIGARGGSSSSRTRRHKGWAASFREPTRGVLRAGSPAPQC